MSKYRQFIPGLIVNLASMTCGVSMGWTSPVTLKLLDENSNYTPLDRIPSSEEISWIGSMLSLPSILATFVAGSIADRIGRKWTLLSSSIFFIISYVLLATTKSITQIYIARLLQGLGMGIIMSVQVMYIGEISTDECRGALGSLIQLFIVTGILFAFAIGPFTSYVLFQWICCIVPVIFATCFYFMPESPYYYIAKGKQKEAIDSLKFLRGKSAENVKVEIEIIQASIFEMSKNNGTFLDVFTNRGYLKALCICVGLFVFQEFSGINGILVYCQLIFTKTGSSLDPAISAILVATVQVAVSGCTPFIADRLGRKLILLISAAGMCIFLTTAGLFFYLESIESNTLPYITWLPLASLMGFVIIYCIGFGPLPWAVLSEMFPTNLKSIAFAIVASTNLLLGFVTTKWFSTLDEAVGTHWTFWLFAICCALAFLFVYTVVIETKGLSLQQIQAKLIGNN